jgi:predicted nuclease of restriction endonuclease-like RecB superfamily
MLTGKMVRVRYARDRILPYYLDVRDESWRLLAEQMIELFRAQEGRTRGELEEDLDETFGDEASTLVHQGLAKLLEDRCDFETVAGHPPEELRAAVFRAATLARQEDKEAGRQGDRETAGEETSDVSPCLPLSLSPCLGFDRAAVLERVAGQLGLTVEQIDRGLFADLKSEQKLIRFNAISPERLLDRYNVALAQAIVLKATRVHVTLHDEPPARYRQLLRQVKFHRLMCEVEHSGENSYTLHLDGPLSLFSATQKYGLQLALFLPTVLLCKNFDLRAELRWGTQKKPKTFLLSHKDRLVPHVQDSGMWVPPELQLFVDSFRKRIADWELCEETEIYPLAGRFWVPDFRLIHKATGKVVLLEVLGFWRKSSAEKHLQYLKRYVREPFLLAVSDQLHIDEAALDDLPAGIHRFRNMPLADEIARLAEAVS